MKTNKYIITFGTKYCENCGHKNKIKPNGYYDGDTGRETAEYKCINNNCSEFKRDEEDERQSNCDHKFNFNDVCKKCGYDSSYMG